jgi:thiol-disulfide isomerase/thioredoxin
MFLILASLADARPKDCVSEEEVAALRAKIAALEAELADRSTEGCTATATAPPTEAQELEASTKFDAINAAIAEGRLAEARDGARELVTTYADTRAGRAAVRTEKELALIGSPAPPLVIDHWYRGQADFSSAPVTLLVFFEEWCPHCRVTLPELEERRATLAARGIQIIAVTKVTKSSTDDKVQALVADDHLGFAVAKETGEMSMTYAVTGIPAAALVRDGVVVWRGHPQRLTDAVLDTLLK